MEGGTAPRAPWRMHAARHAISQLLAVTLREASFPRRKGRKSPNSSDLGVYRAKQHGQNRNAIVTALVVESSFGKAFSSCQPAIWASRGGGDGRVGPARPEWIRPTRMVQLPGRESKRGRDIAQVYTMSLFLVRM